MKCPNCQMDMAVVKTETKYKASIFLDQCPSCGGLWFDQGEMYVAEPAPGENFGEIDVGKLKESAVIRDGLSCPRDGTALKIFADPYFPSDIKVESCPLCGGFWFNRGEFLTFHEEIEEKRKKASAQIETVNKEDAFTKQIESLLATQADSDFGTMANLSKFLMSPVDGRGRPLGMFADEQAQNNQGIEIAQTVIGIIYFLLRIFLKV